MVQSKFPDQVAYVITQDCKNVVCRSSVGWDSGHRELKGVESIETSVDTEYSV